jgi:hypothetical protein
MDSVAIGMRMEFRLSASECCQNIYEVMRFDGDHLCSHAAERISHLAVCSAAEHRSGAENCWILINFTLHIITGRASITVLHLIIKEGEYNANSY